MLAYDNIWTREPRLALPNMAPTGRVAFDVRHPIAPYIKSLVLASQKHDLISGAPITTTVLAAPWQYVTTPYGIAKHSGALNTTNVYDSWNISQTHAMDNTAVLWVAGGNTNNTSNRFFFDFAGAFKVGTLGTSDITLIVAGGTAIDTNCNVSGVRTNVSHGYMSVIDTAIEMRVQISRAGARGTYSGTRAGTSAASGTAYAPQSSYWGQYIMFATCTPSPPLVLLDDLMSNMFAFLRPA